MSATQGTAARKAAARDATPAMQSDGIGTDLMVVAHLQADDAARIDLSTRSTRARGEIARRGGVLPDSGTDLDVFSGRENLAQALILRLLTPQGSLTALGHPGYGSRLHQLIGQHKNAAQRNLCRAFVLEVVAQEPRVEDKAVALQFELQREGLDNFVFTLVVQPKAGGDPLAVSLEVGL